jgi:hypothetical protein
MTKNSLNSVLFGIAGRERHGVGGDERRTGLSVFGESLLSERWYVDPPRICRPVKHASQHAL